MGFNNDGAEAVAARLRRRADAIGADRHRVVLGRQHRQDQGRARGRRAGRDRRLHEVGPPARAAADYLVVNVSSPNTPGLRSLQAVERLGPLLDAVRRVADGPAARQDRPRPRRRRRPRRGRPGPRPPARRHHRHQHHDLPRRPAHPRRRGRAPSAPAACRARRWPSARWRCCGCSARPSASDLTLVSVGGIATADDARARLDAGATLVQAYTGFVYGGPRWPRRIVAAVTAVTGPVTSGPRPLPVMRLPTTRGGAA